VVCGTNILIFLHHYVASNDPTKILEAILDKGPKTENPKTNLKQIDPWIGPFFKFIYLFIS